MASLTTNINGAYTTYSARTQQETNTNGKPPLPALLSLFYLLFHFWSISSLSNKWCSLVIIIVHVFHSWLTLPNHHQSISFSPDTIFPLSSTSLKCTIKNDLIQWAEDPWWIFENAQDWAQFAAYCDYSTEKKKWSKRKKMLKILDMKYCWHNLPLCLHPKQHNYQSKIESKYNAVPAVTTLIHWSQPSKILLEYGLSHQMTL
jgi:hypothetical protein